MIKWFIRFVLFLVFLIVAINVIGNVAVSKILSNQLGVKVKVGKVSLNLLNSTAGLYAIKIGNPESFESEILASIPEISMEFKLKALLKQEFLIKTLRLQISEVTVEKNKDGKFNLIELDAVKSNFQSSGDKDSDQQEEVNDADPKSKKNSIRVVIEDVYVAVGRAKYIDYSSGAPVVKESNLGMKEFSLINVRDTNDLVKQIAYKLMQTIGLNQLTAVIKNEASEKIGAFMQKVKDSMNF